MFATCLFRNKPGGQALMSDFLCEESFLCPRFRRIPEGTQRIAFL